MPSVIIFCKTLLKGGAEKQAITLAKLLGGQKYNVILISWCGDQIDRTNLSFIENNSLNFIRLRGNPVKKFLHLQKVIKDETLPILISYLTLANFIAGISKLFNRKLITIGGIRTEQFPYYKFLFEKFVHNKLNDITVFNNYSAKEKFGKRGFRKDKIEVIHNSINVPSFERKSRSAGEIRIISVCRFVKSKDFRTALHSFKKLTDSNREIALKYYLAGYGPMEEEIRSLVKELDLTGKVEIFINPPAIPDLLKSGDIYLSTSLFEGLSNSIMEAMAAGLPVVATDVGDSRYLVSDGRNGFIVRCRDVDMIVEKLTLLITSEETRTDYGRNSFSLIKTEFSESKLIDNYKKLITKLSLKQNSKIT